MPRKQPAPFKRPSITLSEAGSRSWRHVPAETLRPDDVVANLGLVAGVYLETYADVRQILVVNRFEDRKRFQIGETVFAFVPSGREASLEE